MSEPSLNNAPKWFLASKTVLGGLLAALPALLPLFGVQYAHWPAVQTAANAIVSTVGLLLVMFGRSQAKSPVTLLPHRRKPHA